DCALGIVPLPRTGLVRYILPGAELELEKESGDEIGLVDGSILRGEIRLENEKVVLEHPILETLSIPWGKLRYLIRAGNETQWLKNLVDREVQSSGPLGPRTGVEHLDFRQVSSSSLSVVRIVPQTVIRYRLPSAGQNNNRVFRAALSPIPGSLGDATVILSVGSREFYRKELSAEDASQYLSLPIPAGQELVVGVEFGERLTYPCGIDLHDAHLAGPTSPEQGGRP
ncbi:MAG: hypothetical protein VCA36_01140, partial [Opitutales bacterium]